MWCQSHVTKVARSDAAQGRWGRLTGPVAIEPSCTSWGNRRATKKQVCDFEVSVKFRSFSKIPGRNAWGLCAPAGTSRRLSTSLRPSRRTGPAEANWITNRESRRKPGKVFQPSESPTRNALSVVQGFSEKIRRQVTHDAHQTEACTEASTHPRSDSWQLPELVSEDGRRAPASRRRQHKATTACVGRLVRRTGP
jgi:hypothetical protein